MGCRGFCCWLFLLCLIFIIPSSSWADSTTILKGRILEICTGEDTSQFLRVGKRRYQLKSTSLKPAALSSLQPGQSVVLRGEVSAQKHSFNVSKIVRVLPLTTKIGIGSHALKVAFLRVNYRDSDGNFYQSCTEDFAYNSIFGKDQGVEKYFDDITRGLGASLINFRSSPDGKASFFGPFEIERPKNPCQEVHMVADQVDRLARESGIDLDQFDALTYLLPELYLCDWAGKAEIGCVPGEKSCRSWINSCGEKVLVHEYGHNLGLHHASRHLRRSKDLDFIEYGDPSDVMGDASGLVHFNAPHQLQLGIWDKYPEKVVEIQESGIYRISALEQDPNSAKHPQIYRIQDTLGERTLSLRKNTGILNSLPIDEFEKGLSVHYSYNYNTQSFLEELLSAGESYSFFNAEFSADQHLITINILQVSREELVFEVKTDFRSLAEIPDSDGDSSNDWQELLNGTDLHDSGSEKSSAEDTVFWGSWNGFLSMSNFLELSNNSHYAPVDIEVTLFSQTGQTQFKEVITIPPSGQKDISLNSLAGFSDQSYGLIRVVAAREEFRGRISYYKLADEGSFEFAYSTPLQTSEQKETAVNFNTFQPSQNSEDSASSVYNWLTISNQDEKSGLFKILTYDQTGRKVAERAVDIPGRGRVDLDGGHGLLGPNMVGMHRVIPMSEKTLYTATLTRYGHIGTSSSGDPIYSFAFPISARAANGRVQHVPISRQWREGNWLEVSNASSDPQKVQVTFYQSRAFEGMVSEKHSIFLEPYAQLHLDAGSFLAKNDLDYGFATIKPGAQSSIIAQSMFYHRDKDGSMESMFGSQAEEALGLYYSGSYNLFLGMRNFLRLANTSDRPVKVEVELFAGDVGHKNQHFIEPMSSLNLDFTDYHLALADTYGKLEIRPDKYNAIIVDLLRVKSGSPFLENPANRDIELAFPTTLE